MRPALTARLTPHTGAEGPAPRFEMRALMRLALWGTSAAAALLVAALASYPNLPPPPLVALAVSIAKGPVEGADETRQLAETVRAFQAEREALLARISALEQNLEDTTGPDRGGARRCARAGARRGRAAPFGHGNDAGTHTGVAGPGLHGRSNPRAADKPAREPAGDRDDCRADASPGESPIRY